jgi:hypothetical protein
MATPLHGCVEGEATLELPTPLTVWRRVLQGVLVACLIGEPGPLATLGELLRGGMGAAQIAQLLRGTFRYFIGPTRRCSCSAGQRRPTFRRRSS